MKYTYEKTQDNGDATSSYNLIGVFPVKFSDFFKEILKDTGSFSLSFGASNKKYGGWLGERLNVIQDRKSKEWFFENQKSENWYDEIKDLLIIKCWANGGWGKMLYIVTFDEKKEV